MARRSASKKRTKIPQALIDRLGKRSDQELADTFRVPVELVRRERMLREVAGSGPPLVWTDQQLSLLGTASDAEIAERVGVTPTAAKQQRRRRGIPPYGSTTDQRRHRWTKRQLSWLGKLSDTEIARRLGLSAPSVSWKRRLLGVEPVKKSRRSHQWTKKEIALLGTRPDAELARRFGIHRHAVALKRRQLGLPSLVTQKNQQRWTAARLARLGKVPDQELAEEMGISRGIVAAYRHRHKIPLRCPAGRSGRTAKRVGWQRHHVERLGTASDGVLAEELGITRQAVALVRHRLGIPAFHARGRSAESG